MEWKRLSNDLDDKANALPEMSRGLQVTVGRWLLKCVFGLRCRYRTANEALSKMHITLNASTKKSSTKIQQTISQKSGVLNI